MAFQELLGFMEILSFDVSLYISAAEWARWISD
jgi:hypothetical protein